MRKICLFAVVATAAGMGASPATAATWTVWADAPSKPPPGVPKSLFLDQFFPKTLTVHAGDSITFRSKNFHTATFPGQTSPAKLPLIVPGAGLTYPQITDAAGSPFFFSGMQKFIYNPQAVYPSGSRTVADAAVHGSGILLFLKRGYTVTFPKPGAYKFICTVHPGMKGTIVVKPQAAPIRTQAQVQAVVAKQLTQAFATAKGQFESTNPAAPNTVVAGVGSGVANLSFFPSKLTVPAGTAVTFVENKNPTEIHNMAFGPKAYILDLLKKTDLLGPPGTPDQLTPLFNYGTEPGGKYVYDGTSHGNGFLATFVIDDEPASPPPESVQITFTKPGTYHYFCMVHGPDMAGDIVVTG
jgi:plastocyanin